MSHFPGAFRMPLGPEELDDATGKAVKEQSLPGYRVTPAGLRPLSH